MFNEERWLKIDNAGKIFPYISKKSIANVFRIAFYLKNDINPVLLQQAVDDLKYRFPTFFVKMRVGVFWHYYEVNERKFFVKEEKPFLCSYKNKQNNNGYLIEIFYYKNRISIEIFHAISDANGAVEFGKALVYRYAELLNMDVNDEYDEVIKVGSNPKTTEYEDSFNTNYNNDNIQRYKVPKAYLLKGTKFYAPGSGLVVGKLESDELLELSHRYNCTVTQLLSAVMMKSIYIHMNRHQKKNTLPISILLPVNMRKFYNSQTLRNFSLYIYLIQKIKPNLSLNDFIESIKESYNEQLNIDALQTTLNANMRIEKIGILKYCPLFLKLIALKLGYNKVAGGLSTLSLSNIGVMKAPKCLENIIDNVEFVAAGTDLSHSCCVVSYKGITKISITRKFQELDIEKEFFCELSKLGLKVVVSSNLWEDN